MTKILGKIGRVLIDVQQRFARSSFGEDQIVEFELDMEEFQFIKFARVITFNRGAVD